MSKLVYNGNTICQSDNNIILSGFISGDANVNNNGDIIIHNKRKGCYIYRAALETDIKSWYIIATRKVPKDFADFSISFLINYAYGGVQCMAIMRAMCRTYPNGLGGFSLVFDIFTGISDIDNYAAFTMHEDEEGNCIYDIWFRNGTRYQSVTFDVLTEANGVAQSFGYWELKNHYGVFGIESIPKEYTKANCSFAELNNSNTTEIIKGVDKISEILNNVNDLLEFKSLYFVRNGKNANLIGEVTIKSPIENYVVFKLNNEYRQACRWNCCSLRINKLPYKEIGTCYMGNDDVAFYLENDTIYPCTIYFDLHWIIT